MSKIVIKENDSLTYKEVKDTDLLSLKKEIEKIIKTYKFSNVIADKINVSVVSDNGGNVILNIGEYTCVKSICSICSTEFEKELSTKEAIIFNITNILDNLEDILKRF